MSESKLVDLSTFTYDTMLPHVGSQFRLDFDDGSTIVLELIKIDRLMDKHAQAHMKRDSFSLLFRGPATPQLKQATYLMKHEAFENALGIFLVPVAQKEDGFRYEAVFN